MKHCTLNLIAGGVSLACGIAYTLTDRPITAIATVVVLGIANLAFILAR
jgi:hypothetical protein